MKKNNIHSQIELDFNISTIDLVLEKRCPKGWRFEQKKGRKNYGFVYVLGGKATHHMNDKIIELKKDNILFLSKGSKYLTLGSYDDPYNYIVVCFSIIDETSFNALRLPDTFNAVNPAHYSNLFYEILNAWSNRGIAHKLKCKSILQDIIYNIINDITHSKMNISGLSRIQPAVLYMENNYNNPITIKELSEIVNISVSHFRRIFKEVYGISPIEYLTTIRISKAKNLLLSELYSVSEVAEKVGYSNIYYFSRAFKEVTGDSPSSFKGKVRI